MAVALRTLALMLALLGGAAASIGDALAQTATPRVFYVDWDGGDDGADGLGPGTAWRTAPGDPLAGARPRATRLLPGDTVRFKGGVRYRGTVVVRADGLDGQPITFDGSSWGSTRAVFDGSQSFAGDGQPCPSQSVCLDAPNWRSLRYVPVPATASWADWIFGDDTAYAVGQFPVPADAFAYDDIDQFVALPPARSAALAQGRIDLAGLDPALGDPAMAAGDPLLLLWGQGNRLRFSDGLTFGPASMAFTADDYVPYTGRDNRFAVFNSARQIVAPGQFAISPTRGIAVFWPHRDGARISLGARRPAFVLSSSDHITIRGFVFANFSARPEDARGGAPVYNSSASVGISLAQNIFMSLALTNGAGAANFTFATRLSIVGNTVDDVPWGSGFRIGKSDGQVEVLCNRISRIGQTGIMAAAVREARISGNHISGVNGIHGNAISVYMGSRVVEISDNVVVNSARPLTLSGEGASDPFTGDLPTRMLITRNTFVSADRASAGLISWGNGLRNVTVTGNWLGGPAQAVRLSSSDTGVAVTDNQIVGQLLATSAATQYANSGNQFFDPAGNGAALLTRWSQATIPPSVCAP